MRLLIVKTARYQKAPWALPYTGLQVLRRTMLLLPPLLLGGCEVRWGKPGLLWLLWLLPALLLFFVYAQKRAALLSERFVAAKMLGRLMSGFRPGRRRLKHALVLCGVFAMLMALAEFKYGFRWKEVQRRGVDIVIALDVSDSMLVEDAERGGTLTRIDRAKREITDLLKRLEGDRIALVAFAGSAFVHCPLTLDYGAASVFLDAIDTDLIAVKGTAIDLALEESLTALHDSSVHSKAIILITDGEDHSGRVDELAERAKAEGVRIFPIGIGRDEGAPIPAPKGGFRRDRRGELIISKLDEPTLQKIALTTGGKYVRSVTGDLDLEQIYNDGIKASLEDTELGSRRRKRWEHRFQWWVFLAIGVLALEPLISERPRRRRVEGETP